MNRTLDLIDRFFSIIVESQSRQNQRLRSEWDYLHNLLKNEPVSYDRIDAYLNILKQQNSQNRRSYLKGKKTNEDGDHADISMLIQNIESLSKALTSNDQNVQYLERIINHY